MWKIFSSEKKVPREPRFKAPLTCAQAKYDLEAYNGATLDEIRSGKCQAIMKRGLRAFPLGNATIGASSIPEGVNVLITSFRVMPISGLRVVDAKACGYGSITALREMLFDIYGRLGPQDTFTQVWFKYTGDIK